MRRGTRISWNAGDLADGAGVIGRRGFDRADRAKLSFSERGAGSSRYRIRGRLGSGRPAVAGTSDDSMKIKLDENLPTDLVPLLTAFQHDVHTVHGESLVGQADHVVFAAAVAEARLLITQDLDFSDIRKFGPGTHPGIILVR